MEKCEQCGNSTSHCFVLEQNGKRHVFDSFECAIFAMAPACTHCGCRIMGHGVEAAKSAGSNGLAEEEREIYCCRHCAEEHASAMAAAG